MNWQQLEGFEDIECAFIGKFCIYVAMVNDQYHVWQMYVNNEDMPIIPQQILGGGTVNFRSPVARSYMGLSKSDAYNKAELWASEIETP